MNVYLLSTVVAPSFNDATLKIKKLTPQEFVTLLPSVTVNLCGHPATLAVLREVCPNSARTTKSVLARGRHRLVRTPARRRARRKRKRRHNCHAE